MTEYKDRHTYINGQQVKHLVLKDGVPKIAWNVHDEQGTTEVAECTVSLSNITGEALPIVKASKMPTLDFYIGQKNFFKGQLQVDGFEYDKNLEQLKLKFISDSARLGEILDKISLAELASGRFPKIEPKFAKAYYKNEEEGRNDPELVFFTFYDFNSILTVIITELRRLDRYFENLVLSTEGFQPAFFYVLDWDYERNKRYESNSASNAPMPDWTAKDFLYAVCKLFNAVFWYDHTTTTLHIATKKSFLQQQQTPAVIAAIKETTKKSDRLFEPSGLLLKWLSRSDRKSSTRTTREFGVRRTLNEEIIAENWLKKLDAKKELGDISSQKVMTVELDFHTPYARNANDPLPFLALTKTSGRFVVKRTGTGIIYAVTLDDIAEYYDFEVANGAGETVEVTHSLLKDASILNDFPYIYKRIEVPGVSDAIYVSGMELDIAAAQLKLVGTIYPSA